VVKKGFALLEQTLFDFIEESELMQKENMPKGYDRKRSKKVVQVLGESRLFRAEAKSDRKPFCIVIPPPNVTGSLHMGHASQHTPGYPVPVQENAGYNVCGSPGPTMPGSPLRTSLKGNWLQKARIDIRWAARSSSSSCGNGKRVRRCDHHPAQAVGSSATGAGSASPWMRACPER